jgi:hypothetical protein
MCAQGAFPAPLPDQSAPNNTSPSPSVNGAAPSVGGAQGSFPVNGASPIGGVMMAPPPQAGGAQEQCSKDFASLRAEAEKRGELIKAARERHAPPDDACKLIANFGQAEITMIKFVEAHATQCGIPAQVSDQLKKGLRNTEALQWKVCRLSRDGRLARFKERGPVGDFPPW